LYQPGHHQAVPPASTPSELLRTTFEEVPELYDRARPSYPPQVFADLVALAQLPAKARLVEIGCGTGQATLPLAERGYAITCVELGPRLAALALRKLESFPRVEVINANFETWRPERAEFDAVVAFSSIHWIPPKLRYPKTAELLRARGKLAFVSVAHVLAEDGDPFFVEVRADYETAEGPPHPEALAELSDTTVRAELEASGLFRHAGTRHYLWDVSYTADEYVALLNTYSGHRALEDGTRGRLDARIHRRIEARPGRKVRKTYLALLYVAECL
jgi:protein-L-isoaspartate O-methyltransferase